MVERLVVAAQRPGSDGPEQDPEEEIAPDVRSIGLGDVLPYRAGYETEDRNDIQRALAQGGLGGVVSTSALELGLDW